MTPEDFDFYKIFLHGKSGLHLTAEKTYLLESRLLPVARKAGFATLDKMTEHLKKGSDLKLSNAVVDAMTTNETLFFRDDKPFKQFREVVLPTIIKAREVKKSIRIWSAACSTGQEPYSIAMILSEILTIKPGWRIEILATDISENALTHARKGEYTNFEIQRGLPIQAIIKHFTQKDSVWKINDSLRNMIKFESFNLLGNMTSFGTFDIIFCRNVLIYFDETTKKKILHGLSHRMAADGFLFLGGSETVMGLSQDLKIQSGCSGLYCLEKSSPAQEVSVFPSSMMVPMR